jgi:hypothetical protein
MYREPELEAILIGYNPKMPINSLLVKIECSDQRRLGVGIERPEGR